MSAQSSFQFIFNPKTISAQIVNPKIVSTQGIDISFQVYWRNTTEIMIGRSNHSVHNDTSSSQSTLYSSRSLDDTLRVLGIFNIVAALPTLVLNLSVLIAIIRTNTLRTKTNAILCCILVVNLLQGCVSLPFYGVIIIRIAAKKLDYIIRGIIGYLGASFAIISMLSVDLLTYERYVAINSPFQYEETFRETRIKVAVAFIWVASFVMMAFLKIDGAAIVAVIFATIVTVGTYVFNVVVHILIHRTVKRLRTRQNALHSNIADADLQATLEQQRKERRTIKFCVYIIFFLLACYMPSLLRNVLTSLDIKQTVVMAAAYTFLMMHATLSPVLYIWQSPQIGRAVKRLLGCGASVQVAPAQP